MTDLQASFLDSFAESGNVRASAMTAGVGRRTVYDWREKDPEFAAAFDEAREDAIEVLEAELRVRATIGAGERGPSDVLLMFLLKSLRPDRYRDNVKIEHGGEVALITERLQGGRRRLAERADPPAATILDTSGNES
jgi:hypothetical protein